MGESPSGDFTQPDKNNGPSTKRLKFLITIIDGNEPLLTNTLSVEVITQSVPYCFDVGDEKLIDSKICPSSSPLFTLPSVVRSNILSNLDWEDKIVAAKTIPNWENDLLTSSSWKRVEFTNWIIGLPEHYDVVAAQKDQQNCIQIYGKYFQNCTIALSVFDVQENSYGVKLINQIANQCVNLKSIKIYHEFMFCTFEGKWEDYLVPLKNMFTSCRHLKYVQLCSLDDCPKNKETGKCKFFEVMEELDLCEKVETIEFSLRENCPRPVDSLVRFRHLNVLKTQFSNVSTAIIQGLVKHGLGHLYLHKDLSVHEWNKGNVSIMWQEIIPNKKAFSVYYIFEEVSVDKSDFTVNPYLKSITFSRMQNTLSRDILRNIAALYSTSLSCFAHLSMIHVTQPPYHDMESLPCDYYYFASQCVNLETFVVGVPVPCEAVWCLAMKGAKLKGLHVKREQLLYNYRVCLPVPSTLKDGELYCEAFFCREVSRWLKYQWQPLTEDEMCEKTVRLLHL